jgi:hypothetical protein
MDTSGLYGLVASRRLRAWIPRTQTNPSPLQNHLRPAISQVPAAVWSSAAAGARARASGPLLEEEEDVARTPSSLASTSFMP